MNDKTVKPDSDGIQGSIVSRMMQLYGCSKYVELAKKLGVDRGTVSKYRKGQTRLSLSMIMEVADETGASLDWLLAGKTTEPQVLEIRTSEKMKTSDRDLGGGSYVPVKLLKDEISAGTPAEIRDHDIDGYCLMYADKTWMLGDPEQYTCCRIKGDSMYPILSDGDIIAIDHSQKDPHRLHKKMAAFRYEGGASVKWLSYAKKGIVLGVPENKESIDTSICLIGEDIDRGIIGKVAWWWSKR